MLFKICSFCMSRNLQFQISQRTQSKINSVCPILFLIIFLSKPSDFTAEKKLPSISISLNTSPKKHIHSSSQLSLSKSFCGLNKLRSLKLDKAIWDTSTVLWFLSWPYSTCTGPRIVCNSGSGKRKAQQKGLE